MKKKFGNRYVDERLLNICIYGADEYTELMFPEDAKKDRLVAIAELERLIEEFKDTGDKESYDCAVEKLERAKKCYAGFIDFLDGKY